MLHSSGQRPGDQLGFKKRRFRFTIASLLVVILFLGVGIAALRQSSDLWNSGLFTLTLAVLLISIPLAVQRTENRGAFWLGFALFGWIYLGLSLVPSIESRLITSRGLRFVDSKMPRSHTQGLAYLDFDNDGRMDLLVANSSQPGVLYRKRGNGTLEEVTSAARSNARWFSNDFLVTTPRGSSGTSENFIAIGHSLLALLAAIAGGLISRCLVAKGREPDRARLNSQA